MVHIKNFKKPQQTVSPKNGSSSDHQALRRNKTKK